MSQHRLYKTYKSTTPEFQLTLQQHSTSAPVLAIYELMEAWESAEDERLQSLTLPMPGGDKQALAEAYILIANRRDVFQQIREFIEQLQKETTA